MSLIALLERDGEQIVDEATLALDRSHLAHYQQAGHDTGHERLAELYRLTRQCIGDRNLAPIMEYMTHVADQRFHAGYTINEVQTAINVLEESIWKNVVRHTPPEELAEALGLVSTVLGAAKDSLARTYVSLASRSKAPSLDLSALFEGETGG